MDSDGKFCEYLVISNIIRVRFEQTPSTKSLKGFKVLFNDNHVPAFFRKTEGESDLTYSWTIVCIIPMFSNDNDKIVVQIPFDKSHGALTLHRDAREEFSFAHKDISDQLQEQRRKGNAQGHEHSAAKQMSIRLTKTHCTVILGATPGKIEDFSMAASIADLSSMLPARLTNALDNIPSSLQALEKMTELLGNAHPLATAIVIALSFPYKVLKSVRDFKRKIKDLTEAMRITCNCLMDIRYHTKISSARELFTSITKSLRDAGLFLYRYHEDNWFKQSIQAQMPKKLEKFAEDLIGMKNSFQIAMIMQIARDVDGMPSMTHDYFLRRRLDPAKVQPLEEGCLEGTRVGILDEVRAWLQVESPQNILWIAGAPGAGKTTIATTIAKKLAPSCVKFFCKRDVPELRDPRQIWRTVAFGLAEKHNGVKAALMQALDRAKGDALDLSVIEQFRRLISGPLEADLQETSFRSTRYHYPVIIIDALDECFSTDNTNFDGLLESLIDWARLSPALKLIITSRNLVDIQQSLAEVSFPIKITTGDDASDESLRDVESFFKKWFASIKEKHTFFLHRRTDPWPEEIELRELSSHAAGLFIWADMVVKYVGMRTGGGNPVRRLEDVLGDIKTSSRSLRGTASAADGLERIDRLYARIVFEAFRRSKPVERCKAKNCLAAILLAKEPLRKGDLIQLLAKDTSELIDAQASVESTLHEFSPIILVSDSSSNVRICHQTVSNCLLSYGRSAAAMEFVLQQWNRQMPDFQVFDNFTSFILDREGENRCITCACLRLASRNFRHATINNISLLLQRSDVPFYYARRYWLDHLGGAGLDSTFVLTDFKSLANAMEIAYDCLERHAEKLEFLEDEVGALGKSLRDAADFATQCIYSEAFAPDDFRPKLRYRIEEIEIARGRFQIAVVVNFAQGICKLDASDSFLRKWLQPSDQTVLDTKCLEGTRASVLRQATNWRNDHAQPNILWLVGAPGAGKSTVATTLVSEFSADENNLPVRRVCAKVFAKRDYEDRRDPACIWRTLIYDLAGLHDGLTGSIMEALSEKIPHIEDIVDEQLRFRGIIFRALQEQNALSVVCIIDALDECFTEGSEQWRSLLQTIAGWTDLPGSLKLVVTSRDISEIRSTLTDVSKCIDLNAGNKDETDLDLKVFFKTRFADTLKDSGDAFAYWTQPDVVEKLVDFAVGSFIWAKMAVELVKLNPGSPVDDVLNDNKFGNNGNVDFLYAKVLRDVLGPLRKEEREAFRLVLAFIVLAKTPFHNADLVDLLSSISFPLTGTHQVVVNVVKELNSIISASEEQVLRIPHKSFADFLLDNERSFAAMNRLFPDQDSQLFLVNRKKDDASIAIACLQLMNSKLKFNACGIETSYTTNSDIPELEARIAREISSSLIYALRFWAEHLNDCNESGGQLRGRVEPLLETLFQKNLLYWFEILSLTNEVPSAKTSLRIAEVHLKGYNRELAGVAKDARLFVEMFQVPITAAATHIYISALPFCPSESWITQIYGPQYPSVFSVMKSRQVNWGAAVPDDDAHTDEVNAVAFFPGGGKLASGSDDKTIRIWDTTTGQALAAPFTGHERRVLCVAISPDGTQIASGGDELEKGILRFWDSQTGARPLGSIEAHRDAIYSVAFSPDGSRIVTGSWDNTVKVWNAVTGVLCLGPLAGHTAHVMSVAFSIDGNVVASGSMDRKIRIWDAHTGELRRQPLPGHTSWVWCVAFSPDGRYLASGGTDGIRLWDIAQGFSQTSATPVEGTCTTLSFSPDRNTLVSGFGSRALRFWNVKCGNLEQIGESIYGHTAQVRSVVFAPDGLSVASSSNDSSIKIWTVPSPSTPNLPPSSAESLDAHGHLLLSDESFIDDNGWVHSSWRGDAKVLFWVPEENRGGFWWPRNTTLIHSNVTKLDFHRFVHGEHWEDCRSTSADSEII